MSDSARKGLGEQVSEKVTPDSQKSTLDQAKEGVTGATDRVAGSLQPEDQKSTTQKLGDATRGTGDDASKESKTYMQSASDTLNSAAQTASDTIGNITGSNQK